MGEGESESGVRQGVCHFIFSFEYAQGWGNVGSEIGDGENGSGIFKEGKRIEIT